MKKLLSPLLLTLALLFLLTGCAELQGEPENADPEAPGGILSDTHTPDPDAPPAPEGKTVVNIVDAAKNNPDIAFAMALETIYESDTTVYYFTCIRSSYITVYYSDGSSETVKEALKSGNATIADLDRFHIGYLTRPKDAVAAK